MALMPSSRTLTAGRAATACWLEPGPIWAMPGYLEGRAPADPPAQRLRSTGSISLPLELRLQFALEGLYVRRRGLIALLGRLEHQATVLVEGPLAGDPIA